MPEPQYGQQEQGEPSPNEEHEGPCKMPRRAQVFGYQSHNHRAHPRNARQDPDGDRHDPGHGQHADGRFTLLRRPETPGPDFRPRRDAQEPGRQEDCPEDQRQPLDHERGIHQPMQGRTDWPVLIQSAGNSAQVADEARGPAVGLRTGPSLDHSSLGHEVLDDAQLRPSPNICPDAADIRKEPSRRCRRRCTPVHGGQPSCVRASPRQLVCL
ncbi:hypothetical protein ANMWB30_10050 [Arthrobacter sp. MWB30]|nr:hypothetical protein ANMWB30_10050 [Arthrobacter sp. MWB30]